MKEDDGVSMQSIAHPRAKLWRRILFRLFGQIIAERNLTKALEQVQVEIGNNKGLKFGTKNKESLMDIWLKDEK